MLYLGITKKEKIMVYRSDVIIRMRKEDYFTLVEKFNEKLADFMRKKKKRLNLL